MVYRRYLNYRVGGLGCISAAVADSPLPFIGSILFFAVLGCST